MSGVRLTMVKDWSGKEQNNIELGLLELITDVDRKSAVLAPKDTSALVNSRKISRLSQFAYRLSYGSSRVPYALIQHEGGTIRPVRANVLAWEENGEWRYAKSVKIKGTKYLERAAEAVSRGNKSKYFRKDLK